MATQEIRTCSSRALITTLAAAGFRTTLIYTDPPWAFRSGNAGHGSARKHYNCMTNADIASDLDAARAIAAPDAYLAVWCTLPKIAEWFRDSAPIFAAPAIPHAEQWEYASGAMWGKVGRLGVGYQFRGDAEILLLYRRGEIHPLSGQSESNMWLEPRSPIHSEKPRIGMETILRLGSLPETVVIDLYAGESGSMARACRRMHRGYLGAEIDEARARLARRRLAQTELVGFMDYGPALAQAALGMEDGADWEEEIDALG